MGTDTSLSEEEVKKPLLKEQVKMPFDKISSTSFSGSTPVEEREYGVW